jgi:retron-type reverse transcriptase
MAATACSRLMTARKLHETWKVNWHRVKNSTAGVDEITPRQFDEALQANIRLIRDDIRSGYNYSDLRGVRAPKKDPSKFRIICVPIVRDRLVQRVLLESIEKKAIKLGIANDVSFGFVKDSPTGKRGTTAARAAAIRHRQNKGWVFKTDITAFFDRIRRHELVEGFSKSFKLPTLMPLIAGAIRCEVDDRDPRIRRLLADNNIKKGLGLRQGMPLSPILSNFVLKDFDLAFTEAGYDLVRYADDLIVLASSQTECEQIKEFTIEQLRIVGLDISIPKTEIRAPNEPVEFLGMELGLKKGGTGYSLTVSEEQIARIRETFTDFHDPDFALREKLDLPKLLRRLENMKSGYRAAYGLADNFVGLSQQLDQWFSNRVVSVYASIFTQAKIDGLTKNQRRFLQLPFV